MSRQVPSPVTLRQAVQEVINQNREVGYRPGRFVQITQGGEADGLVAICEGLIQSPHTLDELVKAADKFPGLLTLEDLVAYSQHGTDWELDAATIEQAKARVETLDRVVGNRRWG